MLFVAPIFQDLGRVLIKFGIVDVILPFILVFAIVYAVVNQIETFQNTKAPGIISLVVGLLFVVPHITGQYQQFGFDPIVALNNVIPSIGFLLIAIVLFMILAGLLGVEKAKTWKKTAAWFALLAVIYIFWKATLAGTPFGGIFDFLNDEDIRTLIIVILVFGAIVWFITSGGEEEEGGAGQQPPQTTGGQAARRRGVGRLLDFWGGD